jgi:alpha-mannosidase
MWVESDCNVAGGESLVRQLLLGRNYFKQHFGEDTESPVLWLPDVFGFPWSLPQLIKEAGLDSFFTIKMGWSQYNRLPYDSFWWQGLDGTQVLTHFSTTRGSGDTFVSTYNATATPDEVLTTWNNFQQKDSGVPGQTPPLLMVYGHGDGGGGPTREMVENLQVMEHFPGTPRVRMGKVGDFFQELRNTIGEQLPTWNDELYLEYHRGTYTTQARNKRANRKSEVLLHNLEFIASMTSLLDPDYKYPADDLRKLWKIVCLNQFHDILPGTSIAEVYEESQEQYREVNLLGQNLIDSALNKISEYYPSDLLIVNPTAFSRSDLLFIQHGISRDFVIENDDGIQIETQSVKGGSLLNVGAMPPYSLSNLRFAKQRQTENSKGSHNHELKVEETLLENKFLKVELNESGDIISIYDKHLKQEILPVGALGNQFQAYEDRPKTPDAWEIDITYDEKMWLVEPDSSINVVEKGPLRAAIEIKRTILNSTITQRISLDYNARQLVFDTKVDWKEKNILLKVAFPVQVLSPVATYEIQWGDIQRPTHRNTSWDWAKFEVPAHKWVDLSEGGFGVSLLNDCKYGHDIHKNVIRLTLLRSPSYPDPSADQGQHKFIYSLFPHGDYWRTETIQAAYELNYPLISYRSSGREDGHRNSILVEEALIRVNQPNVIVETIKQAEDENGIIVRLFESQRKRCEFELTAGFKLDQAWRVSILEEELEKISINKNKISSNISPYQILTFRLIPV